MSEHIEDVVDDLTTGKCCRCGTDRELTRPISLLYRGKWLGLIYCEEHEPKGES
jgi:hypothetical protein